MHILSVQQPSSNNGSGENKEKNMPRAEAVQRSQAITSNGYLQAQKTYACNARLHPTETVSQAPPIRVQNKTRRITFNGSAVGDHKAPQHLGFVLEDGQFHPILDAKTPLYRRSEGVILKAADRDRKAVIPADRLNSRYQIVNPQIVNCPVSFKPLNEANSGEFVVASDGHIYERTSLAQWFAINQNRHDRPGYWKKIMALPLSNDCFPIVKRGSAWFLQTGSDGKPIRTTIALIEQAEAHATGPLGKWFYQIPGFNWVSQLQRHSPWNIFEQKLIRLLSQQPDASYTGNCMRGLGRFGYLTVLGITALPLGLGIVAEPNTQDFIENDGLLGTVYRGAATAAGSVMGATVGLFGGMLGLLTCSTNRAKKAAAWGFKAGYFCTTFFPALALHTIKLLVNWACVPLRLTAMITGALIALPFGIVADTGAAIYRAGRWLINFICS
jgi:hypothetical protein